MIVADLHSHTNYSHGAASVEEMCKSAANAGLSYFGLSEHSPLPKGFYCPLYTGDLNAAFPLYAEDVLALKSVTSSPEILLGLELDWIPTRLAYMRNLVAAYPFDYVLGSIHYLDGYSVGALANWPDDLALERRFGRFDAYFREMASLASSGLVQAIAHPDFIKLRSWKAFSLWLKQKSALEAIAHALESMAKNNVALEISSAGLRQDFAEPYPAPQIMGLARDLAVRPVIGSDAHRPEDLAHSFDKLASYARSFGFDHYLIFRQKEAIEMPL